MKILYRLRLMSLSSARAIPIVVLSLICTPAPGQASTPGQPDLDRTNLSSRLDALPDGDPAYEQLRLAIESLDRAATLLERAAEFRTITEGAAERLAQVRQRLAEPKSAVKTEFEPGATTADLRTSESEVEAALQVAKDQAAELAVEAARRDGRLRGIPRLLEDARRRQAALRTQVAESNAGNTELERLDTGAVLALARLEEVTAEIEALESEFASYEARRDLLPARRDLAARKITALEAALDACRALVKVAVAQEAQRAAAEAEALRRQAASQDPIVQAYAVKNAQLIEKLDPDGPVRLGARNARDRASTVRERIDDILRSYESIRARLATADFNRATGRLLRTEFEALEDIDDLRISMAATRRQLEEAEYNLIERREARDALRNVDLETAYLIAEVSSNSNDEADSEALEHVVRELVLARRNVLSELAIDASRYVEALFVLRRAEQRHLDVATAYRSFIRERILWVRSLPADRGPRFSDIEELTDWGTSTESWGRSRASVIRWASHRPLLAAALPGLVLLLLVGALVAPRRLNRIADKLRRPHTDSIWLTAAALVWTVIRALPVSVTLFLIGWVLRRPEDQTQLGFAVGQAFAGAGVVWFGFAFLRSFARPEGLAEKHFRWPVAAVSRIRSNALLAGIVLSLSMAMMALTDSSGLEGATATLGRLGFTVGALAASAFVFRVLHPRGSIVGTYVASGQGAWLKRFQWLWFGPLVGLPLVFVVAAWLGYVYTAYQLSWLLALTFSLFVTVAIGNMFLRRWLFVARRRLAIQEARRRREDAARQSEAAGGEPGATEAGVTTEDDRIDLAGLSAQARQLIRVASVVAVVIGLISIWGDFLPALRLLERIEVYPSVTIVESNVSSDDDLLRPIFADMSGPGATPETAAESRFPPAGTNDAMPQAPAMPRQTPVAERTEQAGTDQAVDLTTITLADLGRSILFFTGTVIAFRNLPGLVGIVLLQRLPLDAGSRYAIDTVLKYAIAIVGLFATLSAVGISWSSIQWLAAAITFGLAFGLQEIFANFISGLIILAERPIRIGDTVTVQNISGTVSRIRMRATTITDWERKELVIPNKAFITGDVVNWTLTDPTLRLSVSVGVSYGTDVDEAEQLLISAAKAEDHVLKDPEPYVNFTAFGESTLNLELRVFVPHIDHLLSTRHALHKRVIKVFREAGIEIAFPQRDLHVRTVEGLGVVAAKQETTAETREETE